MDTIIEIQQNLPVVNNIVQKVTEIELRIKMKNAIKRNDAKEYIKLSKMQFEYFGIINDVRDMR